MCVLFRLDEDIHNYYRMLFFCCFFYFTTKSTCLYYVLCIMYWAPRKVLLLFFLIVGIFWCIKRVFVGPSYRRKFIWKTQSNYNQQYSTGSSCWRILYFTFGAKNAFEVFFSNSFFFFGILALGKTESLLIFQEW